MAKRSFIITDSLRADLTQLLETNRADLVSRYQRVLRESLFSSRSAMRPSMLPKIASDEADAFSNFLHQPQLHAAERGAQLYQTGLSEQPVLRMSQVTRQFFVSHLENGQIAPTLEVIDAYQEGVIQGFIQSLEKAVFNEQERTRHAFERVVNRNKP
ncbi:MAG: hypothetical protein P8183_07725 [Anaerolineae bacterium]|jgi:hypothetical protein